MAIEQDKFLRWAEHRFDDDVKIDGKGSIRLNSIFTDDFKHHMYCHTDPQVKDGSDRPFGTFHCFKTGQKGSLVSLVMQVDNVPFDEAIAILGGEDTSAAVWEERLQEELGNYSEKTVARLKPEEVGLELPSGTFCISKLPEDNYFRISAEMYLLDRKLQPQNYCVCVSGDFKNRIVIPYYDREGNLIYWNTRVIGDNHGKDVLRYRGPDSDTGVGKSDVVYMSRWPELGEFVHLTEGEFDADALTVIGFNGGALGGKNLSQDQAEYLRGYKTIVCLDNDDSGRDAIRTVGENFLAHGFADGLAFVRPPVGFKDWNSMLLKIKPSVIKAYIEQNQRPFDPITGLTEFIRHFEPDKKNFRSTKPL